MRATRMTVAAALIGMNAVAMGSPFVSLQSAADFQTAIDDGRIVPTNPAGPDLIAHYPAGSFAVPDLSASMDLPGDDPDGGLLMSWGDDQDVDYYAQWQYVYDVDPNLTGLTVSATVIAPMGINSVSLAIFDGVGGFRTWDWDVAPFGNGTLTPGVATTLSVLVTGAGLGGPGDANVFADSYADTGVNPANITRFGWDENGNWVSFTQVVPGSSQTMPWNYWSSVTVTPEPATISLLFLGGGLLLSRRRR